MSLISSVALENSIAIENLGPDCGLRACTVVISTSERAVGSQQNWNDYKRRLKLISLLYEKMETKSSKQICALYTSSSVCSSC